jgi:tRNA G18 (ribose-2'-O)-methylase SpoU
MRTPKDIYNDSMQKDVIVILENVRSALNVGSIFRTADGAGVGRILLLGYTPAPIDRFGRVQPRIAKTSLGASESVPWEKIESTREAHDAILRLKADGYAIIAIEQVTGALSLSDFEPPQRVAYIFGNEVAGVSHELLALCDRAVEIPMRGKKESLNVAVCAGIILYR